MNELNAETARSRVFQRTVYASGGGSRNVERLSVILHDQLEPIGKAR
jgi:hypothetical protein